MRVGVIGLGRMGSIHAGLLAAVGVDELWLHDVDALRTGSLGTELGARTCTAVGELLSRVDAVVVASATPSHAEIVEQAVSAGVATFCEKPLASDLATTARLVRLAESEAARIQVGFHRRFDASMEAGHDLVAAGGLGRLYVIRTNSYDASPPAERFVPTSGGLFADVLIHDIDLIRYLTGDEISEVYASGSVLVADYFGAHGDVDVGSVTMELSSGALAQATATRHDALGYDARVELIGSNDSVALGLGPRVPLRRVEDPDPPPRPYIDFIDRFLPAYERELSAFLSYVRGERANPCSPEDAFAAQKVVAACDISRAEHRPVHLEELS